MLSGPAGTGKSRGCLEKLHKAACTYPGMRGLIVRKTRESLTEAALVTFEDKVVPEGTLWIANQQRRVRQSYELPNRSSIVVGGLDKVEKVMSTEYDLIYVQEARELTEHDWESLTTRLRNHVMPYQQIIGDTNPDAPSHWIKQRANRGRLRLIESRHEDNPTVTPEYLARLDALTGVRHKRLRLGIWAAAENMVYPDWDPAVHLIDRFALPPEWTRFCSVDFGFTHAFVCQWWAVDWDGRLYRYRELHGTQRQVRDWAHLVCELSRHERIGAVVTDHDVESRHELAEHMTHLASECPRPLEPRANLPAFTTAAYKPVDLGIEMVANRLKRAGDGAPRLFLLRGSLVERDPLLDEARKPCCLEEEIEAYVFDRAQSQKFGEVVLERPLKREDDSVDAMRYAVMHVDHPGARIGDAVARAMGGR
jgi:phage terminase large subunit